MSEMTSTTQPSSNYQITLLGLGPGDPQMLTQEAREWLQRLDTLYLRTKAHPAVETLPETLQWVPFDALVGQIEESAEAVEAISEAVIRAAKSAGSATYAVPGDPLVGDVTCQAIRGKAQDEGIAIQVIHGVSLIEPTLELLGVGLADGLVLLDALRLGKMTTPGFSIASPALIFNLDSQAIAAWVKQTLLSVYPGDHMVRLVHDAGSVRVGVESLPLSSFDSCAQIGAGSALFVPPLHSQSSFESFQEIIARLRAPDGCPWDREQTHLSLRPFLLEETYETLDALDRKDMTDLQEELGDLLLQIFLHAQIASEEGDFTIHDVLFGIGTKLIRRHPHVFADVDVEDVSGVIHNWEAIKAEEREENGLSHKKGALDGVPQALPALSQAQAIIERAGRMKVTALSEQGKQEVIRQILTQVVASDISDKELVMGDLLLAVAALAYHYEIDAESALRESLSRFRERFSRMEAMAMEKGQTLAELSLEEKAALWQEIEQNLDYGLGQM